MVKSDLKDGMVVEYRNGNRRLVLNGELLGMSVHNSLIYYDEELKNCDFNYMDIVKVYNWAVHSVALEDIFKAKNLKLLWERDESVKCGDKVVVVNSGESYTTYAKWFEKHLAENLGRYALFYAYGHVAPVGTRCNVLFVDKTEKIALVQRDEITHDEVYLIAIKGIKREVDNG